MFPPRIVLTQIAAATVVLACVVDRASAQATPQAPAVPAVGQPAPDFSLTGATRYGLLASPIRLSDFRGKTVVLAFFFQARTRG
jgi:hypothetical protein